MKISKKIVRMGTDLSKHTFHVFAVEESGSTVVKKKRRRKPWLEYFANRPSAWWGWRRAAEVTIGHGS
jgi:hypothetical protein